MVDTLHSRSKGAASDVGAAGRVAARVRCAFWRGPCSQIAVVLQVFFVGLHSTLLFGMEKLPRTVSAVGAPEGSGRFWCFWKEMYDFDALESSTHASLATSDPTQK